MVRSGAARHGGRRAPPPAQRTDRAGPPTPASRRVRSPSCSAEFPALRVKFFLEAPVLAAQDRACSLSWLAEQPLAFPALDAGDWISGMVSGVKFAHEPSLGARSVGGVLDRRRPSMPARPGKFAGKPPNGTHQGVPIPRRVAWRVIGEDPVHRWVERSLRWRRTPLSWPQHSRDQNRMPERASSKPAKRPPARREARRAGSNLVRARFSFRDAGHGVPKGGPDRGRLQERQRIGGGGRRRDCHHPRSGTYGGENDRTHNGESGSAAGGGAPAAGRRDRLVRR